MCRLIHAFASILFVIFTFTVGLVEVASTGEEWVLTTVKPPNPPAPSFVFNSSALSAEQRAIDAEQKLGAAKQRAIYAEQKLGAAEQRAIDAEQKLGAAKQRAIDTQQKLGAAKQRAIDAEQKLGAAEQRAIDAEQKLGAAEQKAVTTEQSIRAEAKHEISIANQRHRNDIDRLNRRLALNLEQKTSELEAYKGMCQQAEMEKQQQQIQISTLQGEKEELSKRVEEVMLHINTEIQKAEVQHAAHAESISEELETEKQQRESLEEQLEQAKLHIGTLQTEKEGQNKEVQLHINKARTEVQQAEVQHTAHVECLSEELETEKQLRESLEQQLEKARFFESMYSAEVDALRKEKMEHIAIQGMLHISCCLQVKQIIVVISCRLSPWSGCDSTD